MKKTKSLIKMSILAIGFIFSARALVAAINM